MKDPCYLDLDQARQLLASMGRNLSMDQMRRAAEPKKGKRKLPFFPDPATGSLIIEKDTLVSIYITSEVHAENNALLTPSSIRKSLEPRP